LINTAITTPSAVNDPLTIFEVADFCTAIRINNDVYHFDASTPSGSKYIPDII